jgi:hypothetical protein
MAFWSSDGPVFISTWSSLCQLKIQSLFLQLVDWLGTTGHNWWKQLDLLCIMTSIFFTTCLLFGLKCCMNRRMRHNVVVVGWKDWKEVLSSSVCSQTETSTVELWRLNGAKLLLTCQLWTNCTNCWGIPRAVPISKFLRCYCHILTMRMTINENNDE